MKSLFNSHDIVILSETWSNDTRVVEFPGFTSKILNRPKHKIGAKRDSGGLIFMYKIVYLRGSKTSAMNLTMPFGLLLINISSRPTKI